MFKGLTSAPAVSIVVPVLDEAGNIERLFAEVASAMAQTLFELIIVDDGSRDESWSVIQQLSVRQPQVRGFRLPVNRGQSAAIFVGLCAARGSAIVTMDADGQHDPDDIPRLLATLRQGADIVCGVRRERKDPLLKRVSSRTANAVRRFFIHGPVHDAGCTFRAFRPSVLRQVPWFRGIHRFFPDLLAAQGYQVAEVVVGHRERQTGRSKYGIRNRIFAAGADLFGVKWILGRQFPAALNYEVITCSTMPGSPSALPPRESLPDGLLSSG